MVRYTLVCVLGVFAVALAMAQETPPQPSAGKTPLGVRQQRVEQMTEELERRFTSLIQSLQQAEPERRSARARRDEDLGGRIRKVWDENFDWIYERLSEHMTIPNYLSVFAAYVEDQPACAGWIYYSSPHFAGLWGGSTLAAYRGRGLYTAVLATRVREAHARGVPYLTIDAGAMSRPIVERHGFVTITCATGGEFKIEAE